MERRGTVQTEAVRGDSMAETVFRLLQIRRDLAANIPILAEGEFFLSTDTHHLWIGVVTGGVASNLMLF